MVWVLVGGQALFRSTDRGDTWQERALPPITPSITDAEISFVSDREGWVASVGAQGEPQCAQQSLRLWHTADGGTTYDGGSAPNGLEARQCKAGLSFIDPQRGFIGAWAPATTPVIYRTTDGGRSWAASRPLPDPPGFTAQAANSVLRIGRVRAFGGTLLVAADGQTTAGGNLYVYRSTDGGTSWSLAATAPIPFSLAFVTASRWIQLSSPQDSRETTDAGSTWHPFTTDYSQAAPVAPSVVFADAEVGYASVRGGLKRTLDGGVHWTTLRTPGT